MITLYHITERSLLSTLGTHTAPSAGNIWKLPVFKMVTLFQICTKVEMQSIIRLFNSKGIKPAENYSTMFSLSPGLVPWDYHLSWPLKRLTKRMLIHTWWRAEYRGAQMTLTPTNFSQGIQALMQHWRKCVKHNGDYSEETHAWFPPRLWNLRFSVFISMNFVFCLTGFGNVIHATISKLLNQWPLSLTCVSGGSVLANVSTADASGSLHFCNRKQTDSKENIWMEVELALKLMPCFKTGDLYLKEA